MEWIETTINTLLLLSIDFRTTDPIREELQKHLEERVAPIIANRNAVKQARLKNQQEKSKGLKEQVKQGIADLEAIKQSWEKGEGILYINIIYLYLYLEVYIFFLCINQSLPSLLAIVWYPDIDPAILEKYQEKFEKIDREAGNVVYPSFLHYYAIIIYPIWPF